MWTKGQGDTSVLTRETLSPGRGERGSYLFLKGKAVGIRVESWGCLSCSPCSSGTFLNPITSNFWLWFGLKVADLSRISQYDHGTITTLRLTEYSDLYEIIHPSLDLAEVVCRARLIKSRCINHTSLLGWLNQDGSRRILLFHEKQSPIQGPESIYWTTGNRKNSVW